MSANDMGRMVKRRMKDAGLLRRLSAHSFWVATAGDLLAHGVPLDEVQHLAGHADPRAIRVDGRHQKKIARNIVERVSIRSSWL